MADAISGGADGMPIWSRICFITSTSLMAAMILTFPPQNSASFNVDVNVKNPLKESSPSNPHLFNQIIFIVLI